ncbi:MAG: PspC domain-containing protein [Planctomycetota bacterium]
MEVKTVTSYPRLLRRSVANRHVAGVCGGLAEYFGLDPTAVRVGYVLVSILSAAFPGILIYIVLWILIPEREYY